MVRASRRFEGPFLALEDDALVGQCEVDHYRASGPGGQKRNKTSSAVRLRHRPTGLAVTAGDDRSQAVNKKRAIRRLRAAIALHVRTPVDLTPYAPSDLLAGCITSDRHLQVGKRDQRYWPVVSEVLDVLEACRTRVRDAARHLGISTAALVKFIQNDPKLWNRVNQMRLAAAMKPLR